MNPTPYHRLGGHYQRARGAATAARVLAALAGRGWLTAGAVARLAGVSSGVAANALTDGRVEVRVRAVRGWCEYRLKDAGEGEGNA